MTAAGPSSLDPITAEQLRIRAPSTPRTRAEYRAVARWWWLEAKRGYPSSVDSLRYAANMRWAADLSGRFGPGVWLELVARESAVLGLIKEFDALIKEQPNEAGGLVLARGRLTHALGVVLLADGELDGVRARRDLARAHDADEHSEGGDQP